MSIDNNPYHNYNIKLISPIYWVHNTLGWSFLLFIFANWDIIIIGIDVFIKILSGKTEKIIDLDDTLKTIFESESIQEIKQIKETGKLNEFNTLNEISILDDVNFDFVQNIIDNIKTEYKTKYKPNDIYGTSVDTLDYLKKSHQNTVR